MDALKTYLRALPDEEARADFAASCGTTLGHLRNVMYGIKPANPQVCVAIEQVTHKKVTRRDMRPEDWHLIWPELVTAKHPAPALAAKKG